MTKHRSDIEVFQELRALCVKPGFMHALSMILIRDLFFLVDATGNVSMLDESRRFTRGRLNQNETMMLAGLMVQSKSDSAYTVVADSSTLVALADTLLEEFHQALEEPLKESVRSMIGGGKPPSPRGDSEKEAIYYAAQSAFSFQYKKFARNRYRADSDWLLANCGLSIRSMIEIAEFVSEQVNSQVSQLHASNGTEGEHPSPEMLSSALTISRPALEHKFGAKAERFLELFSIPSTQSNRSFVQPFAFNEVTARPIIDLGDHLYLTDSYKLMESIYESPFYWMLQDKSYVDQAAKNRGDFLEESIFRLLEPIFGKGNVFRNVTISRSKSDTAAEADVLVVYGEFVLVVQAKSKRLSLEARSGNFDRLKSDFGRGVQAAYDQAIAFADLLLSESECHIPSLGTRVFEPVSRVFPLVVLSDQFPSATLLAPSLIAASNDRFPAIFDIFFLEVVCTILGSPLELLYYLQQRTQLFQRVQAHSESALLGFHLKQKLYSDGEYDFMFIEQDFGSGIEDFYLAIEAGVLPSTTFQSLPDRIGVPGISTLLDTLGSHGPENVGAAIELIDFSSESLEEIAAMMEAADDEVRNGKAIKAFSLETRHGGLSYVSTNSWDRRTLTMAETIGRRYKHKLGKDRWYVLLSYAGTNAPVDAVLSVRVKWEPSDELDAAVEEFDEVMSTSFKRFEKKRDAE